ncbi:hypothetical protein [Cohnella luojiensis]|uniref:Uncharacterized protein n=1 Tax=Cohnella luojiensis TaxID=652876 RepID=A0A4Y8LY71_9BACL|nr:hypothetical protein [Cohnella luojiensis]TFE24861.1 hypothetical protein E2980_15055 [Cohnella luojiensis]
MPYMMRHSPTGTLLACVQRNGYKLAYYGLLLWDEPPSSAQMAEALAGAGIERADPAGQLEDWLPLELTEHEAKMANVKLRNDPSRVVAYRDGVMTARKV